MLHPRERNWSLDEIKRQLNVTRQIGMGHCYFRAKFLLDNVKGVYDYAALHDRYPALTADDMGQQVECPRGSATTASGAGSTRRQAELEWSLRPHNGPYLLYNIYASGTVSR